MSASPGHPDEPSWARGRRPMLIGALSVLAACAAVIGLICYATDPYVTAEQEQIAAHALADPSAAPLQLGASGDLTRWQSPSRADYALVEDRLVVFPQIFRNGLRAGLSLASGDGLMLALVYAPDGQDLTRRPAPPQNAALGDGEWFLFRCLNIPGYTRWWRCVLLIGASA